MGRVLVVLLVLVAVVVGLGVYMDWFKFSTDKDAVTPNSTGGSTTASGSRSR
jgi:hypothetical protein